MKKMMLLMSVLLLSVSCVELNGTLQVNQAFNVKIKSGFLNLKRKTITIAPGAYRAELTAKSGKNVTLELKGGSLGNISIPVKSDSSLNIPSDGQFHIEASKIEQPFHISGVMNTEVDHYGYANEVVRCEIQKIERRCDKVCKINEAKIETCDVVCRDVSVAISGLKEVSFHFMRTDRQANLEFMQEGSTAVVATLPVRGIETTRITDRESICRL
jgi:hypothetical protein